MRLRLHYKVQKFSTHVSYLVSSYVTFIMHVTRVYLPNLSTTAMSECSEWTSRYS